MTAACNTSPLILLAKIGREALLSQLYETILIPGSVLTEVEEKPGAETARIQSLMQHRQVQLRHAGERGLEAVPADLGAGEREAIAVAIEEGADLVILDEQKGRQVARSKGLRVTGTIGIIVEARGRNLLSSVRRELDHLVEAGLWIDEAFYHRVLSEFGE